MRQRWRELLFLHFPCDPAEVAALLPPGLTVDTFPDESGIERAWIGLVPFRMEGIRWSFAPPVPGARAFPETNVRTYVHREGANPGVWFFSLDAMNRLAVQTARVAFALPYFYSRMSVQREAHRIRYAGRRPDASYEIDATLGTSQPASEPGSLEFFLVERYLLYAARGDRLWSGRVHHTPYGLRAATVESLHEDLVDAAGLTPGPFVHALFSEGVDVEVFPLRGVR